MHASSLPLLIHLEQGRCAMGETSQSLFTNVFMSKKMWHARKYIKVLPEKIYAEQYWWSVSKSQLERTTLIAA